MERASWPTTDRDPGCEARAALRAVGRDVVGCGEAAPADGRSPTERLGLSTFDEVAVIEDLPGGPQVVVASGPRVEDVVILEAMVGGGPSTEAMRSAELVVCRDLTHERRWLPLRRTSRASTPGLRRIVVAPLALPGEPAIGAIVLAGHDPGIVTPHEVASVGALADRSILVMTVLLARCREARALLSLDRMRLVGVAVGVLMATEGLGEDDALALLQARSQHSGSGLLEAAVAVLTERQMSFR